MKEKYLEFQISLFKRKIESNVPSLDVFNEENFKALFSGNLMILWEHVKKNYRLNFLSLIRKNILEGKTISSYDIDAKMKRISTLNEFSVLISSVCNKNRGFSFSMDYYFSEFLPDEILEVFDLLKNLLIGSEKEIMYLRKCLCMFLFTKTKEEIAQVKNEILKYQSKPINNKFVLF